MINIKGKTKILMVSGLIIIGAALVLGGLKLSNKEKPVDQEVRKSEISKGVKSIFKGCPDVSTMEKRRECFKDQLVDMRSKNKNIRTKYVLEVDGKIVDTESEDLGDLIKITKPSDFGFARCVSNTFFFDWQNDSIFLSFDNSLGSALCTTTKGEKVYIMPKGLSKDEMSTVKQMFETPIN